MPVGQKPDYDISGLSDIHYNPLQQYRNVTYNIRWTMMPAQEATGTRLKRSYDYKKGIVMFETGGTGTVNLDEIVMETIGTGNLTANYMMQHQHVFRGRMVEPLGGRLIEALSLAAYKLEYPNNASATYLLEIWFVGYDDDDKPVVCQGWDGEPMEFRYYVNLMQLKTQIDYRGAVYEFEMVASGAALSDFMNLEQGFRMTSNPATIGDLCKNLETALNRREQQKVETGYRCYPHKYVITAHKKIKDLKFDYSFWSRGNWSWGQNTGETQIQAGTTIQKFLENVLPNSKELLKHLHKVDEGKKDYNSPDTKPGTMDKGARSISLIVGTKMQDKNGQILFDNKLNGPAEEIHIFITTKEDPKLIISPQEFEDAIKDGLRSSRVQRWIDLGLFRKAYKWIYTGENTEVLTANIKLDYLWRIVRPMWINSETGLPVAPGSVQPPAKEAPAGQQKSKVVTCDEAKKVQTWQNTGETFYAEDIPFRKGQDDNDINPKAQWRPMMPKFYHANTQVQQAQAQSAFMEESAQEYSVYRQIQNQVGAGQGDMYTLDIEVVGDPYWLMQIPSKAGAVPWEADVWDYEENQWDDESLAEKRGKTASHNTLPLFYFEAQIPAANFNDQDLMDLRDNDTITGIYAIKKVTNTFSKGRFTSKLECYRETLANPWIRKKATGKDDANSKPTGSGNANAVGPNSSSQSSSGLGNLGTMGS